MTTQRIFVLFLAALFFSCNKEEVPEALFYQQENAKVYQEQFTLTSDSELNVPLDSTVAVDFITIQFFESGGVSYLAFFDPTVPRLHFYDYATLEKIKHIDFALEGPDGVGTNTSSMGCFVYAPDTIIIHNYWNRRLLFFNDRAEKFSSVDLPAPDAARFSTMMELTPAFRAANFLFLPNNYQGTQNRQLISADDIPAFMMLDMNTGRIDYLGKRSKVYDIGYNVAGGNSEGYGTYHPAEDKVVYSFKQDHMLFETYLSEREHTNKHFVGSRFFEDIPPLSASVEEGVKMEYSAREKVREYILTTPKYTRILFDPWNEVYYRFAYLPRTKEDYIERPYRLKPSIIIIDKNFGKVGEIEIDQNGYYNNAKLKHSIVTKDGLLIPWRNNISDDFLTLKVFKLAKVNQ